MSAGYGIDYDKLTRSLLTEKGYLRAMAEIYSDLAGGTLTRDETSGRIGARRCLESFADARTGKIADKKHRELVEELRLTREAMKHQGNGATSLSAEQVRLPRRTSGGASSK